MINRDFAQTLEQFINDGVGKFAIPSLKNNTIKIKNYLIRRTKTGYVIFDVLTNSQVAYTGLKISAVAIAKGLSEGKNITDRVLYLDRIILKNYNDAVFYKNIIQKTKNSQIKESRSMRLEIAFDRTAFAKQTLEDFIFQKINN
jgi:hypothetical protein